MSEPAGRTVKELDFADLLRPHQDELATLLRRVQETDPPLPTRVQDIQKCKPWSEKRIQAFFELYVSYVRFLRRYPGKPCPPKILRFLHLWMRFDKTETKWVVRIPRGRPRLSDDPNHRAAEIARNLRNGRVGRIYVAGTKVTLVEAAVEQVNEEAHHRRDPRRCNARSVRGILRRGLRT